MPLTHDQHAAKLMAMADAQRTLKRLAEQVNQPDLAWSAARQVEIDALEAGAMALLFTHHPEKRD